MIVVVGRPPNFEVIVRVFPLAANKSVIFTWGDTIYSPGGDYVSLALRAHEGVHCERQAHAGGPEAWWARYLVDPEYRLNEEIPAHRAEYRVWCENFKDRNQRAKQLTHIAGRLASPLYEGLGGARLITISRAREMIR